MKAIETITACGTGYWGMPVNVSLINLEYELNHRWSQEILRVIRYEIQISTEAGFKDRRVFPNKTERDIFLKTYFSDLHLTKQSSGEASTERIYYLSPVIREQLSAVTFVMDYLQFQFGNNHLFNLYRWPVITMGTARITAERPGYRDTLCDFIDKHLISIDEYLDAGLVFDFDTGTIELSFKPGNDLPSQEVAEYSSVPAGPLKVWFAGKDFV